MIILKLGIINDWSDAGFRYCKEKGLEFVEFCVNGNYNPDEFSAKTDAIKGYEEKYGVSVGSIGRWGIDRIRDNGELIESELKNSYTLIDACVKLGCPVFVCGCNYLDKLSYMENCKAAINYFSKLIAYAKPLGVKIAVYNCDWNNFVFNAKAWDIILPELPELGIKYDTSHCLGRKGDYLAETLAYGNRFYHVHIKGSLYVNGIHYDDPPAGLDQVNWGAFFDLLYTKNYEGGLSIEPHSGYWHGKKGQWGVDFTIDYIKQFIMPENYGSEDKNPYMP